MLAVYGDIALESPYTKVGLALTTGRIWGRWIPMDQRRRVRHQHVNNQESVGATMLNHGKAVLEYVEVPASCSIFFRRAVWRALQTVCLVKDGGRIMVTLPEHEDRERMPPQH